MKYLNTLSSYEIPLISGGSSNPECYPGCYLSQCDYSDSKFNEAGTIAGLTIMAIGCIGAVVATISCVIDKRIYRRLL